MFEKTFVISLARRPDRLERFLNDLPPSIDPLRHIAVDGKLCPPPTWWRQGGGAWGCYRSHLQLIEMCLQDGIDSVLILEDDALFRPEFAEEWPKAVEQLPKDWGMIYLGGQHLDAVKHPPKVVNDYWVKPHNVNRTHAYALRGNTMREVYKHLNSTKDWHPRNHIDHHYGRLHKEGKLPIYALRKWLVGQNDEKSDISKKSPNIRFWDNSRTEDKPSIDFTIVVGLHRSGSSVTAGVLHRLGVCMGHKFVGCEENGGHEAATLARTCERAMPYPGTTMVHSVKEFEAKIKPWVLERSREPVAGGKYPHLCVYAPAFKNICGEGLRVVHIDRPLEESIASLIRRDGKRVNHDKIEAVQKLLWEKKHDFLRTHPHLSLEYHDLMYDTERQVDRLIEWLDLSPTEEQREHAITLVRQK